MDVIITFFSFFFFKNNQNLASYFFYEFINILFLVAHFIGQIHSYQVQCDKKYS